MEGVHYRCSTGGTGGIVNREHAVNGTVNDRWSPGVLKFNLAEAFVACGRLFIKMGLFVVKVV